MATIVYAPDDVPSDETFFTRLFLAGSIEMGSARNWQQEYCEMFKDVEGLVVLNPRRPDWDSSWEQSIENPQFRQQVEWELTNIRRSKVVAMYLDPNTKSPISMMELGVLTGTRGVLTLVYCPEGFWRKGNVDILCRMYNMIVYDNEESFKRGLYSLVTDMV